MPALPISPWLDSVPDLRRFPIISEEKEADVVVIGAGIAGVMAAYLLSRAGKKVIILEKNHVASVDTSATTGFLTRVPDTSFSAIVESHGADFLASVFEETAAMQREIFEIIAQHGIECEFRQCDSFYSAYTHEDAQLESEFAALQKAGVACERSALTQAPLKKAVKFAREGQFHSRKFIFELLEKIKGNVDIFEESEAVDFEPLDPPHVRTAAGSIRAKKIIVATGRSPAYFSELNSLTEPKISYVIALNYAKAAPLPEGLFWDTEDPYFYYRKISENTIILGGADVSFDKVHTQKPFEKLEAFARERLSGEFEVTHQWSGTIYHSPDGLPYGFEHPHYRDKVYVCCGFGGNGLVMGSLASAAACDLALGKTTARTQIFSLRRTGALVPTPAPKAAARSGEKIFVAAAKEAEFEKSDRLCKTVNGIKVALFKANGEYHAIHNECSHAGGSLSEGTFEGSIIECPLHGAKFDVTTGEVKGLPATQPQQSFPTRVRDLTIEVEVPKTAGSGSAARPIPAQKHWKSLLLFAGGAVLFWLAQFAAQFFWLTKLSGESTGDLPASLIRSFALSGATLISAALCSSALFKWIPRWAIYWRLRRYAGVAGFIFILGHALSVYNYFYGWDVLSAFYTLNPFENPVVFGSAAFPIFFVMAVTSTDWAVKKLTPKIWKFIHRFVYLAYISSIFHFILINPTLLKNPPGILLLTITAAAVLGQIYWWLRMSIKVRFRSRGALLGILLLLIITLMAGYIYQTRFANLPPPLPVAALDEEPLEVSVEKMKAAMQANPKHQAAPTTPVKEDKNFRGEVIGSGVFKNLNYMSKGSASMRRKDENYFIVFEGDFETPNGPDLQVYLTKNSEPSTRKDIFEGLLLGPLKSVKGKQVFSIPQSAQALDYKSVTIHCKAFNVPWSYVPLRL